MLKKYILLFGLLLIVSAVSNAQDPGTANLTHLWDFEDGTINDKVGDAHGEFFGVNIFVEEGDLVTVPDGGTLLADSWLNVPGDILDLGSYAEISVVAWFTPDSVNNTNWNTIWFFGDDGAGTGTGSDGMALQARRGDNHARFWFTSGSPQGYNTEDGVNDDVNGNYNNNQLYFVVCNVTANGEQGELEMYYDGLLVGTTPMLSDAGTGKDNRIENISPNFGRFCHATYTADIPWVGRIHEIAIYNKALSVDEVAFLFDKGVVSVEDQNGQLPETFSLLQNYPNPFNPGTRISFDLPKESQVKIKIYDMLGKEVAVLLDEVKPAGRHNIGFDGSKLSSGVYVYKMDTGNQVFSKKMILMK